MGGTLSAILLGFGVYAGAFALALSFVTGAGSPSSRPRDTAPLDEPERVVVLSSAYSGREWEWPRPIAAARADRPAMEACIEG